MAVHLAWAIAPSRRHWLCTCGKADCPLALLDPPGPDDDGDDSA